MDPTIVGALIGIGGAAVGAVGGFLGGREQAKGVVTGTKLQLTGQREDNLWQIEREAHAALYAKLNEARIAIGRVVGSMEVARTSRRGLAALGLGSPVDALGEVLRVSADCWHLECLLKLSTPREHAERVEVVRDALSAAVGALTPYCEAVERRRRNVEELETGFHDKMRDFREALDQFGYEAQERFRSASVTRRGGPDR